MQALISVYDKTGVIEFGRKLNQAGYELVSTGGTFNTLANDGGLPVLQVSDVTGSPEILDGRVKTLHPVIYGGILARRDLPDHLAQLEEHDIASVELVACNLYPFVDTIRRAGVSLEEALENIDIGGPTMLRAAAKNFASVAVLVDPADYGWVAEKLGSGDLTLEDRRGLATKAFQHVAVYDAAVSAYLSATSQAGDLPENYPVGLSKLSGLRYGENPHQPGALYTVSGMASGGIATATQLHGRELSFNNLMDADAAWRTVSDFAGPFRRRHQARQPLRARHRPGPERGVSQSL